MGPLSPPSADRGKADVQGNEEGFDRVTNFRTNDATQPTDEDYAHRDTDHSQVKHRNQPKAVLCAINSDF